MMARVQRYFLFAVLGAACLAFACSGPEPPEVRRVRIGSTETIMGMTQWLNDHLRKAVKGTLGCLVITHSDFVVKNLDFDHWFNLDGYETAEAWLHREIKVVDMEQFVEQHQKLSKFVQSQMAKVKGDG